MEIVPLTPALHAEWNALVNGSDDAWMFHRTEFLTGVMEPTWGGTPHHFLVRDGGEFIGICPIIVERSKRRLLPRRVLTSTFGHGGPALRRGLSLERERAATLVLFEHIAAVAAKTGADSYTFTSVPLAHRSIDWNRFATPSLMQSAATTSVIDLTKTEEALFRDMEKRCRNAIRRAERVGFTIRRAESLADIRNYYVLHQETYGRTGAAAHPFEYFRTIWETLSPIGMANFFIAEHDGKPHAAVNVAKFSKSAMYWTGCSSTAARSTGVSNLLQWHAMLWAKAEGCIAYDVGEVFRGATGKLQGLTQFKQSFGGTMVPFYKYAISYRPWRSAFFDAVRRLRR